jgi:hypothetical protein
MILDYHMKSTKPLTRRGEALTKKTKQHNHYLQSIEDAQEQQKKSYMKRRCLSEEELRILISHGSLMPRTTPISVCRICFKELMNGKLATKDGRSIKGSASRF